MKNLKFIPFLFIIAFTGTSIHAQNGVKEGKFEASALEELTVKINSGMSIRIDGSSTDQISYTYSFDGNKAAYAKFFEGFDPVYNMETGFGDLSIQFPETKEKDASYEIKENLLTIKVPQSIELRLSSEYSTIVIRNIERSVEVYNRSGSVSVEQVGQTLQISNEFGDISARSVQGSLNIQGRSSRIDITNITGMVKVHSSYSKMNISRIDGNVNIKNKSGIINAFEIRGNFTAEADYTEFELTDIEGSTKLSSKSGEVSVEGIREFQFNGDYTNVRVNNIQNTERVMLQGRSASFILQNVDAQTSIKGQYLKISAKDMHRSLDILNRSGSVDAENVEGPFYFNGEYSNLELKKFKGPSFKLSSRSGDLSVEAIDKEVSGNVDTEYGSLDLVLSKNYSGALEAVVSHGEIKNSFVLIDPERSAKTKERSIKGFIGNKQNSTSRLFLRVRNGDIRIRTN